MAKIIIEAYSTTTDRAYKVTFADDQQALDYVSARLATHTFRELEEHELPANCSPVLYGLLYPKCEHGLSLDLCAGPQHYPYDDDELRGMGYR